MENSTNTISHILLWIVVVGLGIFLTWSAVNKKSDIDNYAKGANHYDIHHTYYPLSIAPCGALFKIDGAKMTSQPKDDKK